MKWALPFSPTFLPLPYQPLSCCTGVRYCWLLSNIHIRPTQLAFKFLRQSGQLYHLTANPLIKSTVILISWIAVVLYSLISCPCPFPSHCSLCLTEQLGWNCQNLSQINILLCSELQRLLVLFSFLLWEKLKSSKRLRRLCTVRTLISFPPVSH